MSEEETALVGEKKSHEKVICVCGGCFIFFFCVLAALSIANINTSIIAGTAANHAGAWGEMILSYMLPAQNDGHNCDYAATNPCDEEVFQFGKCRVVPKPHQARCDSPCLKGPGTCYLHECFGTCLGNCNVAGDCPLVNYTTSLAASCSYGACLYNADLSLPGAFGGACIPQAPQLISICTDTLAADFRLNDCMDVTVACNGNNTFTCVISFGCSFWKT